MTEQQIFNLIADTTSAKDFAQLDELTRRFITKLAPVSHLLNDDDLAKFICIGVDLYKNGRKAGERPAGQYAPACARQ